MCCKYISQRNILTRVKWAKATFISFWAVRSSPHQPCAAAQRQDQRRGGFTLGSVLLVEQLNATVRCEAKSAMETRGTGWAYVIVSLVKLASTAHLYVQLLARLKREW